MIATMRNEAPDMIPPFRSKQSVLIDAPLEVVWEFSMDLTKIPSFHPRVFKVDLLSGKAAERRELLTNATWSGANTCAQRRT
jgi:uncharacterized membrane protein